MNENNYNNYGQEPIPAAAEAVGKKGLGKWVIAIVAAIVVIAGVAAAAAVTSSPAALLNKGITNSAKSMEKNETVSYMKGVVDGGSVELFCDLETITESTMGYPIDGAASIKLYSSLEPKAALVADVELDGDSVLDLTVLAGRDEVVAASDLFFGDEAYGVNLTKLKENFEDSEFGPDGVYSLGIESLDELADALESSQEQTKAAKKIADGIKDAFMSSLRKNAEFEKGADSLDFNGKTVKTTAVEVTLDEKAISAILADMVEYLASDKELENFLYDNAETMVPLMQEMDLIYGYYEDPEDAIDEFYDALDEAEDALEDLEDELKDANVEITAVFHISKSGKCLVGVECSVETEYDEVKISALAGPSPEKLEEISIRVDDGYDVYRVNYTVKTNDSKEFAAQLKLRENDEVVFQGDLEWDKKNGDFELEFTDDWGDVYGVEGTMKRSGKTASIVLETICGEGEEIELDLGVTLNSSDKMPSVSKYTDLLEMDADDLQDLIDDASSAVYDLQNLMYSMF